METLSLRTPANASASPPKPPRPKASVKLPVKRLDPGLLEILRRRKSDAGILPGLPFN
jgi:hypothetical protein